MLDEVQPFFLASLLPAQRAVQFTYIIISPNLHNNSRGEVLYPHFRDEYMRLRFINLASM